MSYEKTVPFGGDAEKVFKLIRETFLPLDFQIKHVTKESIELRSPGTNWTRGQNPFYCISTISVKIINDEVSIEAQFGGLFLSIIILILFLLFMGTFFGITFGFAGHSNYRSLVPLMMLLWVPVIPVMAIAMRQRAIKLLDSLLNNIKLSG
ncbi:MAG: hypothetical protein P8016_14000 [Sedimentisphaerales bacterium]